MTAGADDGEVPSPCTSVCLIDPVAGLCAGCLRTLGEIAGWIDFSTDERRAVIAAIDVRRSSLGTAIAKRTEDHAER